MILPDLPSVGNGVVRQQFDNAIVSRLPVKQVLRHSLPWPADSGKPSMLRVALEAVIETDVGPLRVISTHLEFYSEKQRLAQVTRLRELHAEACAHARLPAKAESRASPFADTARPTPAILCGDFNSAFDDSAYCEMLAPIPDTPSFVDAWTCVHPGGAPRRDGRLLTTATSGLSGLTDRSVRLRVRDGGPEAAHRGM